MPRKGLMERMVIDCEKVKNTIINFIQSKVEEEKRDGISLGLSGGIDSAVLATLAAEAVGPENVYALYLPDRNSEEKFGWYAKETADRLEINFEVRDITAEMKKRGTYKPPIMKIIPFLPALNRLIVYSARILYPPLFREGPFAVTLKKGASAKNKLTKVIYSTIAGAIEGSFNERHIERRKILEKYSAERNLLLVGAANKSESSVGWFVKDGIDDMPVSPLLELYKNQLRQLACCLDVLPQIIDAAPSPDMFKGVGDELIIGYSYEKIDRVIYALENWLDKRLAHNEGVTPAEFEGIKKIHELSEWKRANPHEYPIFE